MPKRCAWVNDDADYQRYHDEEWGVPVHDDVRLFEMLTLEGAQAGRCLSRADNLCFCSFDGVHKRRGRGGDAREMSHEVQGDALPGKNAARRPFNRKNDIAFLNARAIVFLNCRFYCGIGQTECCERRVDASDHAGLAGGNDGFGVCIRRDGCVRRNVARVAEIFFQRVGYGVFDDQRR